MNNQTKEKTVSITIKLPIDLYNRIDKYYKEVYEINNKQDRKISSNFACLTLRKS